MTATDSAPARRGRILVRIAAAALVFLLVAAAAAWFLRDLPRRQVERVLARRLQADVTLGGLRVFGWDDVALLDLTVTRIAGQPLVARVHVERLVALGRLPDFIDARFEQLVLTGLEVEIAPPPPGPPRALSGPPASATAGRIVIEPAHVRLRAGGREQALRLTGELTGFGTALAGRLDVDAPALDVVPLATLAGIAPPPGLAITLERVAATVTIETGAHVAHVTAGAANVIASAPAGRLAATAPRATATVTTGAGGTTLDVDARLGALVERVTARVTLDTANAPGVFALAVRGAALAPFAGVLVPARFPLAVRGTLDLDVLRAARAAPIVLDGRARLDGATYDALELRGLDATFAGALEASRAARVHGTVALADVRGAVSGFALPRDLAPCRVAFDGSLADVLRPAATGTATVATRGLGTLSADGTLSAERLEARWSWSGARLEPLVAYARTAWPGRLPAGLELRGTAAARGTAAGPLASPRVAAWFTLGAMEAAGLPGALAISRASLTGDVAVSGAALRAEALAFDGTATVPRFGAVPFTARLRGIEADLARGTAAAHAIELASPPLAKATGNARWDAAGLAGALTLAPVELAALRERARTLFDPLPGFAVKGTLASELAFALDPAWRWHADGPLTLAAGGLSSADGSRVIEGLAGTLRVDAHGALGASVLEDASVTGPVGKAQVLWESFFGDFSSVTTEVRARLRPDTAAGWLGDMSIMLPGPLKIAGSVRLGDGPLRFEGSLDAPDLAAASTALVKTPFAGASPLIDSLNARGALALAIRGSVAREARTLSGTLRGSGIDVRVGSIPFEAKDVAFELPFDLRLSAGTVEGEPREGPASFGSLALGAFTLPGMSNRVHLAGDDAWLDQPIGVSLFGGTVLLERLAVRDVLQAQRHAETGLEARDIDLARVTRSFGVPELEGTVNARLPFVAFDGPNVRVDGGGEVEVFGGTVRFGEIRAQNLFSRFPKVSFSAEFHGLDLGRITRRFDVGEMTGIVGGYVRPLELFGWVPVRFDAEVRTEPRKGVKKTINVKAINNVAILGTGGGGSFFERGLARFFKRYTYSALGIHLTLENDAFLLRGLEHRGKRELFLKGRLPLPIDVVNADPGRAVSFRSMVDRLQAIDFSTATTKPAAP